MTDPYTMPYLNYRTPNKHRSMEYINNKTPVVSELVKDSMRQLRIKEEIHATQYMEPLNSSDSPPQNRSQALFPKIDKHNNIHLLRQINLIKQKKGNYSSILAEATSPSMKKSSQLHKKHQLNKFAQVFPSPAQDSFSTLNITSKPIHILTKLELKMRPRQNDSFNQSPDKQEKNERKATVFDLQVTRRQQKPPKKIEPLQQLKVPTKKRKQQIKKFDGIYFTDPRFPQDLAFQEKYASMKHYFNIMNLSNGLYVNPTQNSYKAYVSKGNNGMLVRMIIKNRWWWSIVDEQDQSHFVWTQLKVNTIHEAMRQLKTRQHNESFSSQSAQSTVGSVSLGLITRQDEQSDNETQSQRKQSTTMWSKFISSDQSRKYRQILDGKGKEGKLLTQEQAQSIRQLTIYNEPVKVHNHLENNFHLGNKKALFYNMRSYYESQNQDVFQFLPLTFHIKSTDGPEYNKFVDSFQKRQQLMQKLELEADEDKNKKIKKIKNIWIIKPGEITNRGNGIRISEDLNEILGWLNSKEQHKNGSYKTFIVQLYIDRPLLYNKRKFDIRCYSLLTSINGYQKGYWYTEGYVRTSSKEFSMKNNLANKMVHLTNDAVQKKGDDYGRFEKGNKVSYDEFSSYIEGLGGDFNKIYQKMKAMATAQFRAVYGKIDPNKRENTFEIFGLDFMIDDSFDVWMIEANTNPSIEICCPLLSKLIPQMLDNAFKIALDPLFPPPQFYNPKKIICDYQENKFELVFDEETDGPQFSNENPQYDIGQIEEESEEEEPE